MSNLPSWQACGIEPRMKNKKQILRWAAQINGSKGGYARAKALTKEQLSAIGRLGADATNNPKRRKKHP